MKTIAAILILVSGFMASANDFCTAQRAMLIDQSTGQCVFANNGCEIDEYVSGGFRMANFSECTQAQTPGQDNFQDHIAAVSACISVVLPMINNQTGQCVIAKNGCEASDLANEGFTIASGGCATM